MNALQAAIAAKDTAMIIDVLTIMDAADKNTMKPEERMTYAALCDELEKRYPSTDAVMEAWCSEEGLNDTRTYAQVLIDAIIVEVTP